MSKTDTRIASWSQDLVAGLAVAGLLVPEAVAYSSIAGLPPRYGVIALLAGLLCYGLLGSSRLAIVSATSSSAAVLAAATAALAPGDPARHLLLAGALGLLTGLLFVAAGVARLGGLSSFISKPVLRGFTVGLAVVIIVKQLPYMLGVHAAHEDILRFVLDLHAQWRQWNPYDLALGGAALLLLFALRPLRRVPAALLVIALGIAAQVLWGLDRHGVALVGYIDLEFRLPTWPSLDDRQWLNMLELACALLLVLYAESYGSIRGFALKYGDPVRANRDLLALGLANTVSALCGGMAVGAGYSATSANDAAGARSRLAAWIAGLVVLLAVLSLLPYMELTPLPILAAIVIAAVSHSLKPGQLRFYFVWRRDRLVVVLAVAGVLAFGILTGLLAAVAVSVLMTLHGFSRTRVALLGRLGEGHDFVDIDSHPEAQLLPGLLILRPGTPLFFANAEQIMALIQQRLQAACSVPDGQVPRVLILSLEESPDLDGSSVEALVGLTRFAHEHDIGLLFARLHDAARTVLERALGDELVSGALSNWSVDDAVSCARAVFGESAETQAPA